MNLVMDFDGVFTDPTEEGELCQKYFRERIESLGVFTKAELESWFGELRARLASRALEFGWRSEGRISAFSFEDPFIRAIGFADFLDWAATNKDERALKLLDALKKDGVESFGALSEWAFHQLRVVKRSDPETISWVKKQHEAGHKITIVSNSSPEKIEEFLARAGLTPGKELTVRGNAQKFKLGTNSKKISIGEFNFDVDRPGYEAALIELQPDAVYGDVFSLDLALPIALKRAGKIPLKLGVFYRLRAYTPKTLTDDLLKPDHVPAELIAFDNWSRLKTI